MTDKEHQTMIYIQSDQPQNELNAKGRAQGYLTLRDSLEIVPYEIAALPLLRRVVRALGWSVFYIDVSESPPARMSQDQALDLSALMVENPALWKARCERILVISAETEADAIAYARQCQD